MTTPEDYAHINTGSEEPKLTVWTSESSTPLLFDVGDHPTLDISNPVKIWVPPNMEATTFNYPTHGTTWDYGNADVYPAGIHDLQEPIRAIRIKRLTEWSRFMLNCCKGVTDQNSNSVSCGNLWKYTSETSSGSCDSMMKTYCQAHPDEDVCSCYKKTNTTGMNYAQKIMAEMPLCYSKKCSLNGYKPLSSKNYQCPPLTICTQDLDSVGSNLLRDNVLTQDCSSGKIDNTTTVQQSTNWIYIIIIILAIIIFAVTIVVTRRQTVSLLTK